VVASGRALSLISKSANPSEVSSMSDDDVLFGFRLRLFSLAGEIGVHPACRAMGVHHSTYCRWKAKVDRRGLKACASPPFAADAECPRTQRRAADPRLLARSPRLGVRLRFVHEERSQFEESVVGRPQTRKMKPADA
jgi:hypothetical protein